jgi:hypothetical protein
MPNAKYPESNISVSEPCEIEMNKRFFVIAEIPK